MVKKQSRSKISRAIFLDRDGVINRAILKKKNLFRQGK
jgi:histidinol phosphatase-like enzyme